MIYHESSFWCPKVLQGFIHNLHVFRRGVEASLIQITSRTDLKIVRPSHGPCSQHHPPTRFQSPIYRPLLPEFQDLLIETKMRQACPIPFRIRFDNTAHESVSRTRRSVCMRRRGKGVVTVKKQLRMMRDELR